MVGRSVGERGEDGQGNVRDDILHGNHAQERWTTGWIKLLKTDLTQFCRL